MKHLQHVRVWLAVLAIALPTLVFAEDEPTETPDTVDPPVADSPSTPPPAAPDKPAVPEKKEDVQEKVKEEAASAKEKVKEKAASAEKKVKEKAASAEKKVKEKAASAEKKAREKAASMKKMAAESILRPEYVERQMSSMTGAILPVIASIQASDMSATVLHRLALTKHFERRDARATIELAKLAVTIAHDGAKRLHEMPGLSPQAQVSARDAKASLKEAKATIERIGLKVGVVAGMVDKAASLRVREEALKFHLALANANSAIGSVATEYHISTDMNFARAGQIIGREQSSDEAQE